MLGKRRESPIEWLIRPWTDGAGFAARAGRILAVSGALTALVLPSLVLYYGANDWWWDNTLFVCALTPAGIVVFDQLADIIGRALGRPIGGLWRVAIIVLGLVAGNLAGYCATLALVPQAGRTPAIMFADFRRNMGVLVPVISLVVAIGASSWQRVVALRLESAAARAGFTALKGQMQPHFLFNSLNALKELIADDPELARAFTQRLADLYRLILKVSTAPTAPLADELEIVGHYLEVERVRYGERLRYAIDAPDDLRRYHVPTLMLQTLAENAVKHGIGKARAGGEVRIRAARHDGGGVDLEVSNTGAPFDLEERSDRDFAQTGLANTRARLELMYGKASELSITSDEERGTRVRFFVSGEAVG